MRWLGAALVSLGVATAASGQLAWVGASWGSNWEWRSTLSPDQTFMHSSDGSPSLFVALPIEEDTLFRLQVIDLPHTEAIDGVGWPGTLRGTTGGIDYFLPGSFGQSVFSAGIGSYNYRLEAKQAPPGVEGSKFGWYFGLGEWIGLTRRSRITLELSAHHTEHWDHPTIVTANIGLAFGF